MQIIVNFLTFVRLSCIIKWRIYLFIHTIMDIKGIISSFRELTTQQKQDKLVSVLQWLQDRDSVFASLLQKVSHDEPNDDTLLVLYYDIMMFAQAVENYNTSQDESALKQGQVYMQKLRDREKQEQIATAEELAHIESELENI